MSEIDRYKPEDRRGIEMLYRRTQGADAAEAHRLRWDWQHRRNPYNATGQPDIWVAREGPTVVAQYPTLPVRVSLIPPLRPVSRGQLAIHNSDIGRPS